MNSTQLLNTFRSEMSDDEEPYLWSDVDVYGYEDDAQKMFCRLTEGIADATSAMCSITVPADTDWIELDPKILKIRSITLASNGRPVEVINVEDMASRGVRFEGRRGPLRTLVVGMEEDKARALDTVSMDDALKLVVFRLPLADITAAGSQALEIKPEHHPHLLHWMKHRAYLKQDAETFDKSKSAEFEQRFRAYCEAVRLEQRNKRHKVRTVAYGGL